MEYYEIYDKLGNKTGRIVSHDYKLKEGEYRAISHIVIFNNKDEMLIQKRGIDKVDFPGAFDISAGGGVNANETTYEAAKRELKEELNLSVEFENWPYLRIFYKKGIDDYYFVVADIDLSNVSINNKEVLSCKWASETEILEMMSKKEFVNYNKGFIELLFSMHKNRGTYVK